MVQRVERGNTLYDDRMYPTSVDDLWLCEQDKRVLREFGSMSAHGKLLLMEGAAGSGKTEAAQQLADELGWEIQYYIGGEIRGQEQMRVQFFRECTYENVLTMMTERRFMIVIEDFDHFYRSVWGEKFVEMIRRGQIRKHCIGMYSTNVVKKMQDLRNKFPHILFRPPTVQQVRGWFQRFVPDLKLNWAEIVGSNGDIRVIYEKVEDLLPTAEKEVDMTVQQIAGKMIRGTDPMTMERVLSYYDMESSALQMLLYEMVPQELWGQYMRRKNREGFYSGYFELLDQYVISDPFHHAIYTTMDPHMNDYVGLITCMGSVDIMRRHGTGQALDKVIAYPNHLNRIAQIATNRNAMEKAERSFPGLTRLDMYYIPRMMYVEEWSPEFRELVVRLRSRYDMTRDIWEMLLRGNRFMKDRDRSVIYRNLRRIE